MGEKKGEYNTGNKATKEQIKEYYRPPEDMDEMNIGLRQVIRREGLKYILATTLFYEVEDIVSGVVQRGDEAIDMFFGILDIT